MNVSLKNLRVLILDCQATGANPDKGRLLEVGWAVTTAEKDRPDSLESYLVRSGGVEEVPKRVARVTGITEDDLASPAALAPQVIWNRLVTAAEDVARANESESCPTVIHFCRFEEPYLKKLHQELAPEFPFPFGIICTHEITKRLLPEIPRRGLRAVAGYLGHSVPELRRAAHHVTATAFVWHHLVERLGGNLGVYTLSRLREWIETTDASQTTGRTYPMDRSARLELPHAPGVYRMRRSNGDLLYIGKARSLHRRVNSYFQKSRHHGEHTLEMLTQARQVDVTVTETALEAALLESDEIKRFSPTYNVALRENNRRIAFSTLDMRDAAAEPSDVHRIGPLPSENTLRPLGALAIILDNGLHEEDEWTAGLGFLPEYAPEMECFRSGLDIFRQTHSDRLSNRPALPALLALGRLLWRERISDEDETSSEEGNGKDGKPEPEKGWTPERLASWLENLSLRSAFSIRRARWLCLLSESSLAWADEAGKKKTLVVFSGGGICRREALPTDAPIPIPHGCCRSLRDRQRAFDILTYDRLIVATTELRRLLSEGRKVELRLSPRSVLQNDKISRALEWV